MTKRERSAAARLGAKTRENRELRASNTRLRDRLWTAKKEVDARVLRKWAPLCELGKDVKVRIETAVQLGYRIELYLDGAGNICMRAVKWADA